MTTTYVKPKSKIDTLNIPSIRREENNLRNIETRVNASKGNTYQLLKLKKDIKVMV